MGERETGRPSIFICPNIDHAILEIERLRTDRREWNCEFREVDRGVGVLPCLSPCLIMSLNSYYINGILYSTLAEI